MQLEHEVAPTKLNGVVDGQFVQVNALTAENVLTGQSIQAPFLDDLYYDI